MVLPERNPAVPSRPAVAELPALRDRAVAVLTSAELDTIVDLVAYADADSIVVAAARGSARLSRLDPDGPARVLRGHDPVALQDPLAERADNYPYAGRRLASLFADPRAPDLVVVHTGRHFWPERGGHLGEHGSLNAPQSRAPFLLAGAGVHARGVLPRAARVVDVAPTLAALAGVPAETLPDLDGVAVTDLAAPGPRHVVGLLWDGVPSGELLRLALGGDLPAVGRLLRRGCAFRGGAIAEFPSVTLVNHTCALTGVGPGRHGIIHNAFYDRAVGRSVVANSASSWHRAMDWLRPGVSTVFEWVARARPGLGTACVNEPVDRGATYATFALVRAASEAGQAPQGAASLGGSLPDPAVDPHVTRRYLGRPDYAWATQVDASGLDQVLGLWRDPTTAPVLMWWNTVLTDDGYHAGGPGSPIARAALHDADRRLGVFLDHLDAVGAVGDTVLLLTADHGCEAADVRCRGDWEDALRAAGIAFRDEAYGFLYLGEG